jgi:hypothetical protein
MADPFNSLLDPGKEGTLTGFLGQMMGNPTRPQYQGQITGAAMKKLSELRDAGKDPQRALLDFVNTPEGQDLFINDPQGLETAAKFLAQSVPPKPTLTNAPAGSTTYQTSPTGQVSQLGSTPTTEQQNQKIVGPSRQAASPILTQLREAGKNPQQALIEFVNTPEGKNLLINDPDGLDFAKGVLAGTVAPAPTVNNVPAGGMGIITDQNGTTTVRNPTEKAQAITEIGAIAQLPADALKKYAEASLQTSTTQKQDAVKELVEKYSLDPQIGQKLLAGALQIMPINDQWGQPVGMSVVDITNGRNTFISNKQPNGAAQTIGTPDGTIAGQTQPGVNPSSAGTPLPPAHTQNPDGTVNPASIFNDKRSMFLGTGIMPIAASALGSILEQVDTSYVNTKGGQTANKVDARRNDIQQLHNALISLRDNQSGLGIPTKVIDNVTSLAPGFGPFETPYASVTKGIKLYDLVNQEIAANEAATRDGGLAPSARVEASKRMDSWTAVKRALPTRDSMIQMRDLIANGGADTVSLRSVIQSGMNGIKSATGAVTGAVGDELSGDKKEINISGMTPKELLSLDPAKLNTYQRQELNNRLNRILVPAKKRAQ